MGSYTEYPVPDFSGFGHGNYSVELNTDTGALTVRHTVKSRNPSYLAISENQMFLYAVTVLDEPSNPTIKSYLMNPDTSLSFLNEKAIPGGYPCHIVAKENNVVVACYVTGNVVHYPTSADGKLLSKITQIKHKGSCVNKERQEGAHAHQVAIHPNGKEIFVCDLGIRMITAYTLEGPVLTSNTAKDCGVSEGSGPRHLVFNSKGNQTYVLNELTGTVAVLENGAEGFVAITDYPTLPLNFKGTPSSSAIRLYINGQFLYTTNRTLEAITIFKIGDSSLETIDFQYTEGEELRELNSAPDSNWLIACHQNSHDSVVYAINEDGTVKKCYRTAEILSTCMCDILKQSQQLNRFSYI